MDNNWGVDGVDVNRLRVKWGSAGPDTDFDGNGVIDEVDINIFRIHRNQVVPFFQTKAYATLKHMYCIKLLNQSGKGLYIEADISSASA